MVKFVVQRRTSQGRLGKILHWGNKQVEHNTPSAMMYLRAGHIPHLTWDVAQKQLVQDQTPIYQLTLPSLADSLEVIKKFSKGVPKFCGIPDDSIVHLSVHDPLTEFKTGYNDHKSVAIWTSSGKLSLDAKKLREIINQFECDSFETLFDYDLPRDAGYKRLAKACDRLQTMYDQLIDNDQEVKGDVIVSLGGGFNDFYRRKSAVDVGMKARCDGFNIDLHDFIVEKEEVDEKEIKKLLHETFEPICPDQIRFAAGAFDPKIVALLVKLGIDFFDTSFAIKLAEEGKLFKIRDTYPKDTDYTIFDFSEEKYSDQFVAPFEDCSCYTCKNYTLGYLHHLNNTKELLLNILLVIHNLTEHQRMFSLLRNHLSAEKEN